MTIQKLEQNLSICKVKDLTGFHFSHDLYFIGRTDEEISIVCTPDQIPQNVTAREDNWRAFRIKGILDFSLTGILSGITTILARNQIGIFAISTFNTDYILTKEDQFTKALELLAQEGYEII